MMSRTLLAGLGLLAGLTIGSPPAPGSPRAHAPLPRVPARAIVPGPSRFSGPRAIPERPRMPVPPAPNPGIGGYARLIEPLRRLRSPAEPYRPGAPADGPCSAGDALVVGDTPEDEVVVFTGDTTIAGNICIVNRGTLRVEGAGHLVLAGDITIQQAGALVIDGARMKVAQEWTFQFRCLLLDSARLEVRDAEVDFNGQNWSLTAAGGSAVRFERSRFPAGHASTFLAGGATADLVDCHRPGEFVPADSSRLAVSGGDSAIVWFDFFEGAGGDFTAPPVDGLIDHRAFPDPGITGIAYTIVLDSTSNLIPASLVSNGTNLTIHGSDLAALGLVFQQGPADTVEITGLVDGTRYADLPLDLPDRTLRLLDTRVGAWNYYPFDDTRLRVEDSIFGEILASDSSHTEIATSICDGAGGFVSATGRSEIVFTFSTILPQAITRDRALIVFAGSSLPAARVSAEGASAMFLVDTPPALRPTVADTAAVVEAAIGLPSITPVDASIPVTGTALITPGPYSQIAMDHYLLDYAAGGDPVGAAWARIDSVPGGVLTDTLGVWDTGGLAPGPYMVRLTVVSAPVDTFRLRLPTIKGVTLTEPVGIGPGARDGDGAGSGAGGPSPPRATALMPNAPNPFNPRTEIRYALAAPGPVRLRIYDARGRAVRTLLDGPRPAGTHTLSWDGRDDRGAPLSSGVYLCRMEAGTSRFVRKMLLAR